MKKKYLAIILSLVMCMTALAGCGGKKQAETTETQEEQQQTSQVEVPETQYLATPEEVAKIKDDFFTFAENSAVVQNSDTWNLDNGTSILFHAEELSEIPQGLHVYYDKDDEYGTRSPEMYKHAYKVWATVTEAEGTYDPARETIPYEFSLNFHMLPADEENGILYGYNVAWEEGSTDARKVGAFDTFPFYIFTDSNDFYIEFYEKLSEPPTGVLMQIFSLDAVQNADINTDTEDTEEPVNESDTEE